MEYDWRLQKSILNIYVPFERGTRLLLTSFRLLMNLGNVVRPGTNPLKIAPSIGSTCPAKIKLRKMMTDKLTIIFLTFINITCHDKSLMSTGSLIGENRDSWISNRVQNISLF